MDGLRQHQAHWHLITYLIKWSDICKFQQEGTLMSSELVASLNACMTCGNKPTEIIDVDGAYAVAHFCGDYDTIVFSEQAETPEALVMRWNADNAH